MPISNQNLFTYISNKSGIKKADEDRNKDY